MRTTAFRICWVSLLGAIGDIAGGGCGDGSGRKLMRDAGLADTGVFEAAPERDDSLSGERPTDLALDESTDVPAPAGVVDGRSDGGQEPGNILDSATGDAAFEPDLGGASGGSDGLPMADTPLATDTGYDRAERQAETGVSYLDANDGADVAVDSGGTVDANLWLDSAIDADAKVAEGGEAAPCAEGETRCAANAIQACTDGAWTQMLTCGTHQTCGESTGAAQCSCETDPACTVPGPACVQSDTLVTCVQDAQHCLYRTAATACSNGACSGGPGVAACCVNSCTPDPTCVSSSTVSLCQVGPNGCTSPAQLVCSNGLVCGGQPSDCFDSDWAAWPAPNGQGDVTDGAPNLESYTDNGDGTVTDNVTKLMWQQTEPTTRYTWNQAIAYCQALTLGGHRDWRLPSITEMFSLTSFERKSPAINTTFFPNASLAWHWTSTRGGPSSFPMSIVFDEPLPGHSSDDGSTSYFVRG